MDNLITQIEKQTSKLNCAQNEEEKEKEKHQLEENCKKYFKIIHTKQYKPLRYLMLYKKYFSFLQPCVPEIEKKLVETIFVSLQADKMPRFCSLVTLHPPPIVRNSDIRFPSLWTVEKEPKTWCAYSG